MAATPQLKRLHLTSPGRDSDEAELRDAIQAKLTYALGKTREAATDADWYQATALAVRDRVINILMQTRAETKRQKKKRVYYLSIEFLIGRLLFDTLTNLQLVEPTRAALASLGADLDRLREVEPDAALGNGGLGRLAACFLDSMSALGIPAYGYGIRYENGLFEQRISDGWQQELPEDWLARGNPWELNHARRPLLRSASAERWNISAATTRPRGRSGIRPKLVLAVPYDTPIAGWRGRHANMLRLWSARAVDPIHLATFNRRRSMSAPPRRAREPRRSRAFLYPNDSTPEGQELRLRQEYFFTSASLQDLTRRHLDEFPTLDNLAD